VWVRQAIHHFDGDLEARMAHWAGGELPPNSLGRTFDLQSAATRRAYNDSYGHLPSVRCEEGCKLEQLTDTSRNHDLPEQETARDRTFTGFDLSYNKTSGPAWGFQVYVCVRAKFRCVKEDDPDYDRETNEPSKEPLPRGSVYYFLAALDRKYQSYDDYVKAVKQCVESLATIFGRQVFHPRPAPTSGAYGRWRSLPGQRGVAEDNSIDPEASDRFGADLEDALARVQFARQTDPRRSEFWRGAADYSAATADGLDPAGSPLSAGHVVARIARLQSSVPHGM